MDLGDNNTQEPFVKRVTLPSGKSIEVLYFGDCGHGGSGPVDTAIDSLHICGEC